MIAYLQGKILEVGYLSKQIYIVVLTESGVGYQIFVPTNGVYSAKKEIALFTSFQVREDSHSLYGFIKKEQKNVFEDLIQISGIGPKVALSTVSVFSPKEFRDILIKGDYKSLGQVKGLGQKGAKKIVLELQGIYVEDKVDITLQNSEIFDDLKEALESLGFQGKEKEKLMKKARDFLKTNPQAPIETLISYVLKR